MFKCIQHIKDISNFISVSFFLFYLSVAAHHALLSVLHTEVREERNDHRK